jgi:hypothetical protein
MEMLYIYVPSNIKYNNLRIWIYLIFAFELRAKKIPYNLTIQYFYYSIFNFIFVIVLKFFL